MAPEKDSNLEALKNELNNMRRLARWMPDYEAADELHRSLNVAFAKLDAYESSLDREAQAEAIAA